MKLERLIGLSDFEDSLVTRLYFREVWTVILELLCSGFRTRNINNAAKVNAGEMGNIHDMQLTIVGLNSDWISPKKYRFILNIP